LTAAIGRSGTQVQVIVTIGRFQPTSDAISDTFALLREFQVGRRHEFRAACVSHSPPGFERHPQEQVLRVLDAQDKFNVDHPKRHWRTQSRFGAGAYLTVELTAEMSASATEIASEAEAENGDGSENTSVDPE